jgi:hypothetical protein
MYEEEVVENRANQIYGRRKPLDPADVECGAAWSGAIEELRHNARKKRTLDMAKAAEAGSMPTIR